MRGEGQADMLLLLLLLLVLLLLLLRALLLKEKPNPQKQQKFQSQLSSGRVSCWLSGDVSMDFEKRPTCYHVAMTLAIVVSDRAPQHSIIHAIHRVYISLSLPLSLFSSIAVARGIRASSQAPNKPGKASSSHESYEGRGVWHRNVYLSIDLFFILTLFCCAGAGQKQMAP